jgi:uncharacterized membrane protein
MLYAALILESPNDRGFLISPFCPIYGFSVIAIYLLFHTPKDMTINGSEILQKSPVLRYLSYCICAGLFATLLELITGFFFHRFFHVRLWNYQGYFGNINGYIAFFPSLAWGGVITLFMRLIFYPIFLSVKKYKAKTLSVLSLIFLCILIADTAFNFTHLLLKGKWYNLNFLFP